MREVIAGQEGPGTVIVVNGAVHLVAAAFCGDVQCADAFEFRRVVAEVDLDLFKRFHEVQRRPDGIAGAHVGHGHTVDGEVDLPQPAAGNRHGAVHSAGDTRSEDKKAIDTAG